MAENEKVPSYTEALIALSGLEFDTGNLIEGEFGEELRNPIHVVATIFVKSYQEVVDDLVDHRQSESDKEHAENELRYGNLDEYGEVRGTPTAG